MKNIFLLLALSIFSTNTFSQERVREQKPPAIDELFAQMDTNKDAKLSKEEVKGPLNNDFKKIDLNKDGFLTKEELEKAKKPNRAERPKP